VLIRACVETCLIVLLNLLIEVFVEATSFDGLGRVHHLISAVIIAYLLFAYTFSLARVREPEATSLTHGRRFRDGDILSAYSFIHAFAITSIGIRRVVNAQDIVRRVRVDPMSIF